MNTEAKVYESLKELGLMSNLSGYKYTSWIISNILDGNISTDDKLMCTYALTAHHFNTTPTRVERAIRHAIERAFDNAIPQDIIGKYFGNTIPYNKGKVPNKQFIISVVEHIKINNHSYRNTERAM
jgi:two-component system response regulator (stage 0 sporulation protein A)